MPSQRQSELTRYNARKQRRTRFVFIHFRGHSVGGFLLIGLKRAAFFFLTHWEIIIEGYVF